jgi:branched-chain amino acid transport system ATP-binding protein
MTDTLLEVEGVEKFFGGFRALGPVDLTLRRGEHLGIIGPNGSGKTTLINCISGTLRASKGRVLIEGSDVTLLPAHRRARMGMSRSFQIPKPFTGMTVLENLLVPLDQLARSTGGANEAMRVLGSVGLQRRANDDTDSLSQLELRKLELARVLIARPKLVIVDEAMAGLSEGEIDDILILLARLGADGIAVIMIEHIMHAIMRFSHRIVCLEAGRVIADDVPKAVAADAVVQKVYFGEQTSH